MPHSTVWAPEGVTWTYWGRVTGEELVRSNQEIYRDARFPGIRYQIVDLTGVERFDVTPEVMTDLAGLDHSAALTNPSVRVAVAAGSELIRQLSLYYEAQSTDSSWEQQVFDTLHEAQTWACGR